MKITIIGGGLGNIELLSTKSRDILSNSPLVLTTTRLRDSFHQLNSNIICMKLSEIIEKIKTTNLDEVVVLASGDVGFFSISQTIKRNFPLATYEFVAGLSSFQYFFAKLQLSYENVRFVSLHGRESSPVGYVCYNEKTFFLTGGKIKAHDVVRTLIDFGLGEVKVFVGENLSSENERIVSGKAGELANEVFSDLSVMYVQNDEYTNPQAVLYDEDFLRDKVPITKAEVREISLSKLSLMPTDVAYDIGAGSGSVSLAMARRTKDSLVYAIEKKPLAVNLIRQNIVHTKTKNVVVLEGEAVDVIGQLPPPDKVFIGGSSGDLDEIVSIIVEKNERVKIVVNAITLETLAQTIAVFKEMNFSYETICVNVSKAEKLGNYNLMKAQNPIYIITGEKNAN